MSVVFAYGCGGNILGVVVCDRSNLAIQSNALRISDGNAIDDGQQYVTYIMFNVNRVSTESLPMGSTHY